MNVSIEIALFFAMLSFKMQSLMKYLTFLNNALIPSITCSYVLLKACIIQNYSQQRNM